MRRSHLLLHDLLNLTIPNGSNSITSTPEDPDFLILRLGVNFGYRRSVSFTIYKFPAGFGSLQTLANMRCEANKADLNSIASVFANFVE